MVLLPVGRGYPHPRGSKFISSARTWVGKGIFT